MGDLQRDLWFGLRMLMKAPGFTVVAAFILSLGIGANTAVFSVVDAVFLRPMPFADPDHLVVVWEDAHQMGFPQNTPAPANFVDWKMQNHVFSDMAALAPRTFNLTGESDPEKVEGFAAGWNVFPLLGVKPALGRTFLPDEDRPDGPKVALVSHSLWQQRFGGDLKLVGRTIFLNGDKYTVIGVMPTGFHFPFKDTEIWTPLGFTQQQWAQRGTHYLHVIARLKPGVTLERARADMNVIAQRLAREYPDNNTDIGALVVPVREQYVGDVRRGLLVLLAAVVCVLFIACANLTNLVLSRATARTRELAVRTALGASGFRIARQLVTENLLLAGLGGLLGIVLASWSFGFLKQLVPADIASAVPLELDLRVLVFTVLAAVVTALLVSLVPVLQAARLDVIEGLKQGDARAGFSRRNRTQNSLVVAEVALTTVLLISSVLLLRSFANLRGVNPGFRPGNVLTLRIVLPRSAYPNAEMRAAFFERAAEKLSSLPGMQGVGFTSALPLVWKGGTSSFAVEGRPLPADALPYDANDRVVSPGYMQVMGMTLRAGRFFEETDGPQSQSVVIINETMARMYFPGEAPLGKRIKYGSYSSPGPWRTIIGVVADVKQMGLDLPSRPEMYFPYRQAFDNWMVPRDIILRTNGNPTALAAAARQRVWDVDRNQPVSNLATLDDILDEEVQPREVQAVLLGAFAALALVLACVGLYGVLSFLISQRTREIGVRMALGAQPADILAQFVGRGLSLALGGIAIGFFAAFAVTRLLASLLFGVSGHDPLTFFVVPAILLLVSAGASFLPSHRAMRTAPIAALRYE